VSDALALAVARAIRAERVRAGLTQDELGAKCGMTNHAVSRIETLTRKVSVDELPDICDALGISFDQLLWRAPEADRRKLGLRPS
jgi:transcriptional regulator with XRE-family HTH domain